MLPERVPRVQKLNTPLFSSSRASATAPGSTAYNVPYVTVRNEFLNGFSPRVRRREL